MIARATGSAEDRYHSGKTRFEPMIHSSIS